ncbi:Lipase precursor [Labilithrix luteola]|uniref:Lipase n=2 Tax=Labilithrix luteola TaxID=1391654 RepID=A0A0K1PZJ4_9BACT|nr:Lipase precursor [Labilithrix luteola]
MCVAYIVAAMRNTTTLTVAAALAVLSLASIAGCADTDESGADTAAGEEAFTAKPSSHAIVLAHGFDASTTNRWSFYKVADKLRADGNVVHAAQVSPYRAVPDRAVQLAAHVDAALAECRAQPRCDASKVHIVAHSMGGLDARYLISTLGYGDRVASLTTISTPHHGSRIADVLVKIIPDDFDGALNAIGKAWAKTFTSDELAEGTDLEGALRSISEQYTTETFNKEVLDDPRVTYLSWAGVSNFAAIPNTADREACEGKLTTSFGVRDAMNVTLVPAAGFVAHGVSLRPNDGMVTVESAKWGKFMGCIPADHLDEVGQPKHDSPDSWTGFDHLTFYRRLVSKLDDEVAAAARR